ncbi:uncharacterized protein TNCV_4031081 [Trichonephila clavipes]|nr:uncharacterized protein TNCV_4031081 [Trichonephila clavipes]
MPTFKITLQVGNPDLAYVVRSKLATRCYISYEICTSAYLITWTNRHRLKRDSPFSRMQAMDLLDQDIEEHFLKNVFNPQEGLPRVHFKPEMGAHTSKNQDPPEYLRQLALEIINKIPATAMQIYTDGSKDEQNSCGSGIFIKAPNCSHNIKIRIRTFVLFLDPS